MPRVTVGQGRRCLEVQAGGQEGGLDRGDVDANDLGDPGLALLFLREREERADSHPLQEGDSEAKYWLGIDAFEAIEAHAYNMSPADKRTVRQIIFEHFDYIVSEWQRFQEQKDG